jgi:uncharacterized protein YciI
MPLYVISWTDKLDSLPLRMATREAHLAYAKTLGDRVKLGGPFLDEAGQMAGSLIIIEADSLDEAKALHAEDPYAKAGLFERSDVRPYRITLNGLG